MTPPLTTRFVDDDGPRTTNWDQDSWEPLLVRRAELDAEVMRLGGSAFDGGRRRSLVTHPRSTSPGLGLTPGIEVALEVLLPGESTPLARHSSSIISFCIQGGGEVEVNGTARQFRQFDTWNIPALRAYSHHNTTDQVQARLVFSNSALLHKLGVHWVDPDPQQQPALGRIAPATAPTLREIDAGALLMGYEDLINPPVVEQPALLWPWDEVRAALESLETIDGGYDGRRLFLLYNPATGRMNGTTPAFFSTITVRPPDIVDRPHRHAAAAINYFFQGSGWSRIGGRRYTWDAGDLMFTAPAWTVHNHASGPEPVYEMTIQDFPFHLANDSLLWQEDLKLAPRLLGSSAGFSTNRSR